MYVTTVAFSIRFLKTTDTYLENTAGEFHMPKLNDEGNDVYFLDATSKGT